MWKKNKKFKTDQITSFILLLTESAEVMSSLIVTFCITKTANRTKKSQTQLSHNSFE